MVQSWPWDSQIVKKSVMPWSDNIRHHIPVNLGLAISCSVPARSLYRIGLFWNYTVNTNICIRTDVQKKEDISQLSLAFHRLKQNQSFVIFIGGIGNYLNKEIRREKNDVGNYTFCVSFDQLDWVSASKYHKNPDLRK